MFSVKWLKQMLSNKVYQFSDNNFTKSNKKMTTSNNWKIILSDYDENPYKEANQDITNDCIITNKALKN